jgi:SAM-dependent methyltransferase
MTLYKTFYNSRLISGIRRVPFLAVPARELQRFVALLTRPYHVSRYFENYTVRKLQIGAAVSLLSGWLNSDLYPKTFNSISLDPTERFPIALDATKRFPFPDQSFDYVFSEHQMEHIPYHSAVFMLAECHRILRPGGKIRIAMPSLDRLVELLGEKTPLHERYMTHKRDLCYPGAPPNPCIAFNAAFMNWTHRFIYDRDTLCCMLRDAGFRDVRFFVPGESNDPNLVGIEARTAELDAYETMVAQGIKSA